MHTLPTAATAYAILCCLALAQRVSVLPALLEAAMEKAPAAEGRASPWYTISDSTPRSSSRTARPMEVASRCKTHRTTVDHWVSQTRIPDPASNHARATIAHSALAPSLSYIFALTKSRNAHAFSEGRSLFGIIWMHAACNTYTILFWNFRAQGSLQTISSTHIISLFCLLRRVCRSFWGMAMLGTWTPRLGHPGLEEGRKSSWHAT